MNDCCGLCSSVGPACAASQWVPETRPCDKCNGTCILKATRDKPINAGQSAAFFPPGVVPPAPVITQQGGLIVGDWKIVTGDSVNMAIFTGPHYPNKTTPYNNGNGTKGSKIAVPGFECSAPGKRGCLFNIVEDPTE
jgi:hypothetical protein